MKNGQTSDSKKVTLLVVASPELLICYREEAGLSFEQKKFRGQVPAGMFFHDFLKKKSKNDRKTTVTLLIDLFESIGSIM